MLYVCVCFCVDRRDEMEWECDMHGSKESDICWLAVIFVVSLPTYPFFALYFKFFFGLSVCSQKRVISFGTPPISFCLRCPSA